MARTLLLRMAADIASPAAVVYDETTFDPDNPVVEETVTLTQTAAKRVYKGPLTATAGPKLITLKSGSAFIGGDEVIVNGTDGTVSKANSMRLDLTGTSVGGIGTGGITTASIADGAITDAKFTVPTLTGVATGILSMIHQIWWRFFRKATKDDNTNEIKTFAANGSTVLTTQSIGDSGGVETQGPAS